jgi:non-ribosomal peptide synthase protein (TIGR01720 family)
VQAEQGPVTGPVPLTPIQHWFFERELPDAHHFNQTLLIEIRERLDIKRLRAAAGRVLMQHDALRLRFERDGTGWRQRNDDAWPCEIDRVFTCVDLTGLPEDERRGALERAAAGFQASLSLERGPLLRVTVLRTGEKSDRLMIAIHHLGVDGVSWRVLLEDLLLGYEQLGRGHAIQLLPKTTSFKTWAERLTQHARSDELAGEAPFWLELSDVEADPLPLDHTEGADDIGSGDLVVVSLTAQETQALLQEVPAVYRTQINDALLTAVVQAFAGWTESRSLLLNLEGHGREELFDDVELSRTVGWFTSLFPVRLNLEHPGDPGESLKSIKEQLRRIPGRGIGYGLLRYLRGDEQLTERLARCRPQVMFNYLGQLDRVLPEGMPFKLAPESSGPSVNPSGLRTELIEIGGGVGDGRLTTSWSFSRNRHERATIERLAGRFLDSLRALIIHCQQTEEAGFTPSDFPLADLSQDELDGLLSDGGE